MKYRVITFFREQPMYQVTVFVGTQSACLAMAAGYRKFADGQVYEVVSV